MYFIFYIKKKLKKEEENQWSTENFAKTFCWDLLCDSRVLNIKLKRPGISDENDRLDGKPHFIFLCPERKQKNCLNRKIFRGRRNFFCEICKRKSSLHPRNYFERYIHWKLQNLNKTNFYIYFVFPLFI